MVSRIVTQAATSWYDVVNPSKRLDKVPTLERATLARASLVKERQKVVQIHLRWVLNTGGDAKKQIDRSRTVAAGSIRSRGRVDCIHLNETSASLGDFFTS